MCAREPDTDLADRLYDVGLVPSRVPRCRENYFEPSERTSRFQKVACFSRFKLSPRCLRRIWRRRLRNPHYGSEMNRVEHTAEHNSVDVADVNQSVLNWPAKYCEIGGHFRLLELPVLGNFTV